MLLSLLLCAAQAQEPEKLVRDAFGSTSAEVIFLLDTSVGLSSSVEELKPKLAELVGLLPEGDRVTVLAVHTRSNEVFPTEKLTAANRVSIMDRLKKLNLPSANEADQGAAAAAVAGILERSGANPLRLVVWVSDFCHTPSIQSPWYSGGRGCQPIRNLELLSRQFPDSPETWLSIHYLPIERSTPTSGAIALNELKKVLGGGLVAESAVGWFKKTLANPLAFRYRPLAENLARTAHVELAVNGVPDFENPLVQLEFRMVPPQKASLTDLVGAGLSIAELSLDPTAQATLQLSPPEPAFSLIPGTQTIELPIAITGTLKPVVPEAWAIVELEPPAISQQWNSTAAISYTTSSAPLLGLVGLGLVVGGVGIATIRSYRQLPLGGRFTWRKGMGERQVLESEGKTELSIGLLANGMLGLCEPERALLVIRRRSGDQAVVIVRQGGVEINSRAVLPGEHVVFPGASSFQYEDYRLSWE